MRQYIPKRGDLVWLNFNPQTGHKQSGKRSAAVLSPAEYNKKVGLKICCLITFEVGIPNRMKILVVILVDQVKSFDWQKKMQN